MHQYTSTYWIALKIRWMLMVKILLLSYWLTWGIAKCLQKKSPKTDCFVCLKILGIISFSILNWMMFYIAGRQQHLRQTWNQDSWSTDHRNTTHVNYACFLFSFWRNWKLTLFTVQITMVSVFKCLFFFLIHIIALRWSKSK